MERNYLFNELQLVPCDLPLTAGSCYVTLGEIQTYLVYCKHAIKSAPRLFLMLSLLITVDSED